MKPSTRRLSLVPSPARLEKLSVSLATLDAILSPEWQYRYYSFNKSWDAAGNQRMASMRNGSGDDYFILFTPDGAALKGFAHEYPLTRACAKDDSFDSFDSFDTFDTFEGFPEAITGFLDQPAFAIEDTTFCMWCTDGETWTMGRAPEYEDGSEFLLELLTGDPRDYQIYAAEYFEAAVPLVSIEHLYAHEPLTQELVHRMNADIELATLLEDISEIGYPVGP